MARSSRAQTEVTAAQVLASAQSLFAERGYHAVALEEVAHAAHVTRGAVYHHYGSKAGVFEAVAAGAQADVATAVRTAAESAPDDWSGFLAGCRAFLVAILADPVRRILLIDAPAVLGWAIWRGQDAAGSGQLLEQALVDLVDHQMIMIHSARGTAALLSGAMNEAALSVAEADEDHDTALESVWIDLERILLSLRITPGPSRRT